MLLEYNGTHDYQENYLQNGYQMGFENSRWIIYSNETLNSFVLGHFYRCIRDESLEGYTMFDPDYPNLQRGLITVKANGTEITGETVCVSRNRVKLQVRNTLLRVLSNMVFYKKR